MCVLRLCAVSLEWSLSQFQKRYIFTLYLNNNEAAYQASVVSQTYATTFNWVEEPDVVALHSIHKDIIESDAALLIEGCY